MSTNSFGYRRTMENQNSIVQPLLTDLYQITMAYAYWKSGKVDDVAVFDLFFRTNPFHGEFTIFAGLEECLKFLHNFKYSETDIDYLKQTLPATIEPEFFEYLEGLTCKDIVLSAVEEGSVVFPRVPLLRVEGPLIIAQLLETILLTLVNFARYRMVAGKSVSLLEFGLRRAQGPDGGLSASKYAYVGGFDGTSNVLAGKMFNIPVKGTHAHSYVTSFSTLDEIKCVTLRHADTQAKCNLLELALEWRTRLSSILDVSPEEASDGELAALTSYAIAFPSGFMALVDTYDVKRYNFKGLRSRPRHQHMNGHSGYNSNCETNGLNMQPPAIRTRRGYSTVERTLSKHLHNNSLLHIVTVTCQKQPALGCVYKLVEINGQPRIKLSHDVGKVTIPGHKEVYWKDGHICTPLKPLSEVRERVQATLKTLRQDIKRSLNPTPYKVAVSDDLYAFIHDLWLQNAPIGELS
ncbi:unnamed protein product [Leptidea sinapis]|uniref:nicotinate phosphoribosyltransferase n=1 Tax=Leptidea sinapis TaxID=189913 RepID=A0A5E4Q7U6_9NEOP|nr:unnamed protein product [Leptidea sinapis]